MVQPTTQPTPSHCITSVHYIPVVAWACWLVSNPSIQKPHLHLRSCHIQPPLVSSPVSHHLPLPYTTFPKPPYAANTRCAIPHTYPAASTRIQQHPSGTPTTPPGCLMFRRLFPVHFETSPCGAPAHTMSTSCVLESEPWRPPQRANGASGVHPRRSTPMSVRSTPMLSGCLPLFTATTAPGGSGGVLPYCIEQ